MLHGTRGSLPRPRRRYQRPRRAAGYRGRWMRAARLRPAATRRCFRSRPVRRHSAMIDMLSALGHAWRSLRRTPVFAGAATCTLVLGIAAAAAMFAVVHGVLLAPLPYGDPERLVSVGMDVRSPEPRRIL